MSYWKMGSGLLWRLVFSCCITVTRQDNNILQSVPVNIPAGDTLERIEIVVLSHRLQHGGKGLKLGADDYLVKPFDVVELVARVEAVLRRYNKTEQHLTAGDVTVDLDARRVTKAGRPIELTNKEFGLLLLFMKNKNVALFRETLYCRAGRCI